jgi:hypothetical protein
LPKATVYQVPVATDKCISVTPNIKIQMLGNIHEMVCESNIVYGIECGNCVKHGRKHKIHSRFCRKLMGKPNCAASGYAEMELGRDSRTVQIIKYWYRIMRLNIDNPAKQYYERQKNDKCQKLD